MTTDYGEELNFDGLDIAEDGGTVTGVELLKQAAVIRLSTPRGSVGDSPDDGIDLVDWLSRPMDPGEVASLAGTIEGELKKDERFAGGTVKALVDASQILSAGTFAVELEIDAGAGPFQFTLGVGPAGVLILGGA